MILAIAFIICALSAAILERLHWAKKFRAQKKTWHEIVNGYNAQMQVLDAEIQHKDGCVKRIFKKNVYLERKARDADKERRKAKNELRKVRKENRHLEAELKRMHGDATK
jgi:hypothetical protein